MERYTLDEVRGDIDYEVDGDQLVLRVRPEFVSTIPVGDKYFLLVSTDENTNPSDFNIMSSMRVLKEIKKSVEEYGFKGYWELILGENDEQIIAPIGDYHVFSYGDVVAYATANPVANTPVTGYDTFGLVKIASGSGLIVTDGVLSIDPSEVGGLDQEALESYLTINKYVTEGTLATNGYLMLTSPLTGYAIADAYTAIGPTDTVLTAIGKLERRFDGYVDLTTDQTVGGVKTFTETIYGNKDIVCYATDSAVATTPVASKDVYGLVKIGDNLTVVDGVISAVAQQSGVQFTLGTALELTSNSVLNVKFGTTSNTACAGNDSRLSDARVCPYSLSWSGYNSGSYNGSASKSLYIPYLVSDLDNDSGYIKDGNGNFTTLSGSGNSSQYLAGNGQFYTIAASEISFPYGFVTLSTAQTITAQKWMSGGLVVGPTSNVHIRLGLGSGNCVNGYKADDSTLWNIYLNYSSSSAYTLIDPDHNVITTGDVVAYATSSATASTPVASASTFGLVKIGSGISVSDGVISVSGTSSGSGGGWASGTYTDNSICRVNNSGSGGLAFWNSSSYTGCKIGGGNGVVGYSGSYGTIGNLYLNYVSGTVNVQINDSGKITYVSQGVWSDMRLKNKLESVGSVLDKITALDIFYYRWKTGDSNIHIGVSAQQVMGLFPILVDECRTDDYDSNAEAYLTVDYQCLNTLGLSALKELYALHLRLANEVRSGAHWRLTKDEQIRQLQRECAELRVRVNELEKGGAA